MHPFVASSEEEHFNSHHFCWYWVLDICCPYKWYRTYCTIWLVWNRLEQWSRYKSYCDTALQQVQIQHEPWIAPWTTSWYKSLLKEVHFHIIQLSCRPWQRSHKDYYKDYRTVDCGDFGRGCWFNIVESIVVNFPVKCGLYAQYAGWGP